jgi:hypothetical protein
MTTSTTQLLRAAVPLRAPHDVAEQRIAAALDRFPESVQMPVRALARQHGRLADLALSFPALLFALAVSRHRKETCDAIAMTITGARLATIAATAHVPMWLRALEPTVLTAPFPPLPDSLRLRREMVNYLPRHATHAADWFAAVGEAGQWCGEDAMIWFARECDRTPRVAIADARDILLWAWFSKHAETLAAQWITVRWHPELGYDTALAAARTWIARVLDYVDVADTPLPLPWLVPDAIDGYTFSPLLTQADLTAAARELQNCLESYVRNLASNRCQVWVVRRHGAAVAAVELTTNSGPRHIPIICEVLGCGNGNVPREIWQAVWTWYRGWEFTDANAGRLAERMDVIDRSMAWRRVWRPFWIAHGRYPTWLPISSLSREAWETRKAGGERPGDPNRWSRTVRRHLHR